jgi:hypothetical protein
MGWHDLTYTILMWQLLSWRWLNSLFQDIWSCSLYNGDVHDTENPLRCIFKDEHNRLTYFENMSRAMALLCDTSANVMTKDPKEIPKSGIYGRIEEPTLQQTNNPGGQVNLVSSRHEPI